MSRPLRIEYPDALYHVTARGNAKNDIFHSDFDREVFLKIFSGVVRKNGVRLNLPQFNGHFKKYTDTYTMKKRGVSDEKGKTIV